MHTAVRMNKLPNISAVWPAFIAEGPDTPPQEALSTSPRLELAAAAMSNQACPSVGNGGPAILYRSDGPAAHRVYRLHLSDATITAELLL